MKKFKNPVINVSLFDVENIVTDSTTTDPTPIKIDALQKAKGELGKNGVSLGNILVF